MRLSRKHIYEIIKIPNTQQKEKVIFLLLSAFFLLFLCLAYISRFPVKYFALMLSFVLPFAKKKKENLYVTSNERWTNRWLNSNNKTSMWSRLQVIFFFFLRNREETQRKEGRESVALLRYSSSNTVTVAIVVVRFFFLFAVVIEWSRKQRKNACHNSQVYQRQHIENIRRKKSRQYLA